MTYDVDAQVGGKLAQLGGRLINGVAKKYADDFFAASPARRTRRRNSRLQRTVSRAVLRPSPRLDSRSGGSQSYSTGPKLASSPTNRPTNTHRQRFRRFTPAPPTVPEEEHA
jgi:hypothetical protein